MLDLVLSTVTKNVLNMANSSHPCGVSSGPTLFVNAPFLEKFAYMY